MKTSAVFASASVLLLGLGGVVSGCSSSSTDSLRGTGGSTGSGGSPYGGTSATGGSSSSTGGVSVGGFGGSGDTGGSATGGDSSTGGTTTGGSPATGGSAGASTGGTSTGGTNTGGTSTGGTSTGGTSTGGTSTGGTSTGGTSTGGAGGAPSIPTACDSAVTKGGACTTEGTVCSKTCGPDKVGYKTETCTSAAYIEGACTFPPGDYSCYQKANPLPACGGGVPTNGATCTDAPCTPCGPTYYDSTATLKTGTCVCTASSWSCASDTAWPPQDGAAQIPPGCDSSVAKGGACTPEGYECSKTCGPKSVGYKVESCTSGFYAESVCLYDPSKDYSCFQLPTVLTACSSTITVQHGTACTVADCHPCGPDYLDSKGVAKIGYCVCAGGDAGSGLWSCASSTAWPPQQ